MESVETTVGSDNRVRLKLILTKCRVRKVVRDYMDFFMEIVLPNQVALRIDLPPTADVIEGDIVTLYTEVFTNANPQSPSVQ